MASLKVPYVVNLVTDHNPPKSERIGMHSKTDEMILKTAKEIIVKFIEIRTVTPTTFYDHFQSIYTAVEKTVRKDESDKPPKE